VVIFLPCSGDLFVDTFGCILFTFLAKFEAACAIGLKINNINQK